MEKKNLGDLTKYLNAVQEQGGADMTVLANGKEVKDFEDIVDVDHVKNRIDVCTVNTLFNSMKLDYETQHKALVSLCKNIDEYGWEIHVLNLDEDIAYAEVIEELTLVSKNYNEEKDIWE